ncbi:C-4 sterol methyl oxidase, partial [Cladochytrium tenue]
YSAANSTSWSLLGLGLPQLPIAVMDQNASAAASAVTYNGIDQSALSFPEKFWVWMLDGNPNPDLTIGMFFLAFIEGCFFARMAMYLIIDSFPSMHKYRLQGRVMRRPPFSKVMQYVIWTTLVFQVPIGLTFRSTLDTMGANVYTVPFPPAWVLGLQLLVFAIAYDTSEYWVHRALHWGPLYRHIHKVHHEAQTPYALISEYMHPVEFILIGLCVSVGPLSWGQAVSLFSANPDESIFRLHAVVILLWSAVAKILSVDAHSGYDLPWGVRRWPLLVSQLLLFITCGSTASEAAAGHFNPDNTLLAAWTGPDWHDYHHEAFASNYAAVFRFWDWWCETDAGYRARLDLLHRDPKIVTPSCQVGAQLKGPESSVTASFTQEND